MRVANEAHETRRAMRRGGLGRPFLGALDGSRNGVDEPFEAAGFANAFFTEGACLRMAALDALIGLEDKHGEIDRIAQELEEVRAELRRRRIAVEEVHARPNRTA